jgi:hypothetical protein
MSAVGESGHRSRIAKCPLMTPKRTFGPRCDSKDATGEPMQYFEASDGKPERIGKVIGDTLAALVILAAVLIAFNVFR